MFTTNNNQQTPPAPANFNLFQWVLNNWHCENRSFTYKNHPFETACILIEQGDSEDLPGEVFKPVCLLWNGDKTGLTIFLLEKQDFPVNGTESHVLAKKIVKEDFNGWSPTNETAAKVLFFELLKMNELDSYKFKS